ncbi:hypothetical protein GCM10023145_05010 [Angustibacter luteus]
MPPVDEVRDNLWTSPEGLVGDRGTELWTTGSGRSKTAPDLRVRYPQPVKTNSFLDRVVP